jgi:hypothetical protein
MRYLVLIYLCLKHAADIQTHDQGCLMVYLQTKNPNFGLFLKVFERVYFIAILVFYGYFGILL